MSDFDVLGIVGKLALPTFARFRICGNPSLGLCDMAPRTEATGVFLVHLRAVFRPRFRLAPVNSRRSESSLSCMNVSSFQRSRACRSTCCESVGKFRSFQQNLISSACFHARGRCSSRCRISTILVSSESFHYLIFNGTCLSRRRAWVRKI